jgi:hypothetical protein
MRRHEGLAAFDIEDVEDLPERTPPPKDRQPTRGIPTRDCPVCLGIGRLTDVQGGIRT